MQGRRRHPLCLVYQLRSLDLCIFPVIRLSLSDNRLLFVYLVLSKQDVPARPDQAHGWEARSEGPTGRLYRAHWNSLVALCSIYLLCVSKFDIICLREIVTGSFGDFI